MMDLDFVGLCRFLLTAVEMIMQRKLLRLLFRTRKRLSFRLSRKTLLPRLSSSAIRSLTYWFFLKHFEKIILMFESCTLCIFQIETCRKVENIFKRLDRNERQLHVLPFHAALAQGARLTNMEEFTSSHPEDHSLFLVCTDRYFVNRFL